MEQAGSGSTSQAVLTGHSSKIAGRCSPGISLLMNADVQTHNLFGFDRTPELRLRDTRECAEGIYLGPQYQEQHLGRFSDESDYAAAVAAMYPNVEHMLVHRLSSVSAG